MTRARRASRDVQDVEEERQGGAEHAIGRQTPEEIAAYQIEMIRQEAHEIWLIRRGNNQPGDETADWREAERHYFTNN